MIIEIKRNDNAKSLNYTIKNENNVISTGIVEKIHVRYINEPKKWNIITYTTLLRKNKQMQILTIAKADISNKKVVVHV